jgi:hypothetical protein
MLDEFLAAERMHDRRFQFPCQLDQFVVSIRASSTAKDGNLPRIVENTGDPGTIF